MIKCNFGTVSIEGNKSVIKAELSTIILAVKKEILTEEEINECVDRGLHTTEEDIDKCSNEFADKLKKILEILEG